MVVSSSYELYSFLISLILGIMCGVIYDLVRSFKQGRVKNAFFDVLFWVLIILSVCYMWMRFLSGELRWYLFVGVFLSLCIYFLVISKWIFLIFSFIVKKTYCFFNLILKFLLTVKKILCKILSVYNKQRGN